VVGGVEVTKAVMTTPPSRRTALDGLLIKTRRVLGAVHADECQSLGPHFVCGTPDIDGPRSRHAVANIGRASGRNGRSRYTCIPSFQGAAVLAALGEEAVSSHV